MTESFFNMMAMLFILFLVGLKADRRHKDLQLKLDFLFKRTGTRITDIASPEVRRLIQERKNVDALRLLRQETGLGLREAKGILEEIQIEIEKGGLHVR